ncbi:MAG: hypothetical protein AB7O52_01760 [Planctomycetota bacterium]
MASASASEPSPSEASDFLFGDLAVDPPAAEFDRVFQKKIRSFDSAEDPARALPYRKAYALGKERLQALLGEEGKC